MKTMLIVLVIVVSGVNAFAAQPSSGTMVQSGALTAGCAEPLAPPFSGLLPDATGGGFTCNKAVFETAPKPACLGTKNVSSTQNYCIWTIAASFGTTLNSIAKMGDDGSVGADIGVGLKWKKLNKCGDVTVTVPAPVKESKTSNGADACAPTLDDVKSSMKLKDVNLCRDGDGFDYDGDLKDMIRTFRPGCGILTGNMNVEERFTCDVSSIRSVVECLKKAPGEVVMRIVSKSVQEVCNASGNSVDWMLGNLSRVPRPPQPPRCATTRLSKLSYEASISPSDLLAVPKICAPMLDQGRLVPPAFMGKQPETIGPGVNDDACTYVKSTLVDFREGRGSALFVQGN